MKKLVRFLKTIFSPKDLHGLDVGELLDALSDSGIRKLWLYETLEELKRINLEIDRRLTTNKIVHLTDLAVRRKAYQDVLEAIVFAKRQIKNHNPKAMGQFDLDSVTVGSAYL